MSATFILNDGGRAAAGLKRSANDCACRALAIASGRPYVEIYALLNEAAARERTRTYKRGKRAGKARPRSSARNGVYRPTFARVAQQLGFEFVATMSIGSGCTVHLRADELPLGRIICSVSKHYVAVIDGVIHDTHDPSRGGTRCVYGYFQQRGTR